MHMHLHLMVDLQRVLQQGARMVQGILLAKIDRYLRRRRPVQPMEAAGSAALLPVGAVLESSLIIETFLFSRQAKNLART